MLYILLCFIDLFIFVVVCLRLSYVVYSFMFYFVENIHMCVLKLYLCGGEGKSIFIFKNIICLLYLLKENLLFVI